MSITGDMTIIEVMEAKENAALVLLRNGMHCLGCPTAQMETLEEACGVHRMDLDKLLSELNSDSN